MFFVIYGPEGSGKGTQAKLLARALNLPIYESGDLVRKEAKEGGGLIGKKCREALAKGVYVDDDTMFTLWEKILASKQIKKGFVLDGFPRNLNQTKFLTERLKELGLQLTKVIYIKLSDEQSMKRLLKRRRKLYEGSNISHDDREKINKRLKVYRYNERELLPFFRREGLLLEVNGAQTIEGVFESIMKGLKLNEDGS